MGAVPAWALVQVYGAHLTSWRQRIFRETTHGGSANFSIGCLHMNDVPKPDLRAHYRNARADFVDALNDQERAIAFSMAPAALKEHFVPGQIVAAYIPVGSEADPGALLQQAVDAGCLAALPHVTGRAAPMQFLRWAPSEPLDDGPFGLKQPLQTAEPCRPDVILVPLVAFDSRLMRLGQGAGHYDRALSLLENVFTVGIAWSVQQAPALPADPWDIPLHAILTEKAWIAP
jgi:5-formyltetrahydrofolate cyclo-ligase